MGTKGATRPWPDVAMHPGELLAEELEARSMTQKELAEQMGRPKQLVNEIVLGKKRITAETALDLERVLSTHAHIWVRLQGDYDLVKAKLERKAAH